MLLISNGLMLSYGVGARKVEARPSPGAKPRHFDAALHDNTVDRVAAEMTRTTKTVVALLAPKLDGSTGTLACIAPSGAAVPPQKVKSGYKRLGFRGVSPAILLCPFRASSNAALFPQPLWPVSRMTYAAPSRCSGQALKGGTTSEIRTAPDSWDAIKAVGI